MRFLPARRAHWRRGRDVRGRWGTSPSVAALPAQAPAPLPPPLLPPADLQPTAAPAPLPVPPADLPRPAPAPRPWAPEQHRNHAALLRLSSIGLNDLQHPAMTADRQALSSRTALASQSEADEHRTSAARALVRLPVRRAGGPSRGCRWGGGGAPAGRRPSLLGCLAFQAPAVAAACAATARPPRTAWPLGRNSSSPSGEERLLSRARQEGPGPPALVPPLAAVAPLPRRNCSPASRKVGRSSRQCSDVAPSSHRCASPHRSAPVHGG